MCKYTVSSTLETWKPIRPDILCQGPSKECAAKTEFRQLSAAGKAAILDKHNELRRRVAKGEETNGINGAQPAASNMKKMVWNEELEAVAQRWADQCTFGHDKKREKLDGTYVRHLDITVSR